MVTEGTMNPSDSIHKIVRTCFPHTSCVIDCFHVQKPALEAVQQIHILFRGDTIRKITVPKIEARDERRKYKSFTYVNKDTQEELAARVHYLLYKSPEKGTESWKTRASLMFDSYPDIETAYGPVQCLRTAFNKKSTKAAVRPNLARWYNKI